VGKFAASIQRPKTKSASASGLCPWIPLGLCSQTPVISSRYRARHDAVHPDVLGENRCWMSLE